MRLWEIRIRVDGVWWENQKWAIRASDVDFAMAKARTIPEFRAMLPSARGVKISLVDES